MIIDGAEEDLPVAATCHSTINLDRLMPQIVIGIKRNQDYQQRLYSYTSPGIRRTVACLTPCSPELVQSELQNACPGSGHGFLQCTPVALTIMSKLLNLSVLYGQA